MILYSSAIFENPPRHLEFWQEAYSLLLSGAHVASFGNDTIFARALGFELRDTVAVIGPVGWRPVFLFRKPLSEKTVADQVLKTGTGAINIDACRIGTSKRVPGGLSRATSGTSLSGSVDGSLRCETGLEGGHNPNLGRWPSNLVLVHAGCKRAGTKRVRSDVPRLVRKSAAGFHPTNQIFGTGKGEASSTGYADSNGLEIVDAWECVPQCPVLSLDQQSGKSQSRVGKPRANAKPGRGWGMTHTGAEYADPGGASRFYPQFENIHELLAWLTKLVTPSGGSILYESGVKLVHVG